MYVSIEHQMGKPLKVIFVTLNEIIEGDILDIERVRTGNIERETWRYLNLFSNKSYVSRVVKEEAAREQIVACIEQAQEIFSLAKSASILTKPVLLYYGMQRLAKALIFMKNPAVNLNNLKDHGLSGRNISDRIERFWHNRIPRTRKGIFNAFCTLTTKNTIMLKKTTWTEHDYHRDEFWIERCDISDFLNISEFEVRNLFSLIPELFDLSHFLGRREDLLIPCHLSVREHPDGAKDFLWTVAKKISYDALLRMCPALVGGELIEENEQYVIQFIRKDTIELPTLVQEETGEISLLSSIEDSRRISIDQSIQFCVCA